MYAVWGTIPVKPEHVKEFAENFSAHARRTNDEPGCVRFDAFQDTEDPTIFYLYEVFKDKAALDTHNENEGYLQWRELSQDWRAEGRLPSRILTHLYPEPGTWR